MSLPIYYNNKDERKNQINDGKRDPKLVMYKTSTNAMTCKEKILQKDLIKVGQQPCFPQIRVYKGDHGKIAHIGWELEQEGFLDQKQSIETLASVVQWIELVAQQEKITERKRNVNHKTIRPYLVGLFLDERVI